MKRYWIAFGNNHRIVATTIASFVVGCAVFINGVEGTVIGEYYK